jgi:hypothetical protein
MFNKENQQPQVNEEQPYTFSDEVTKRKIKRHLNDINDVITENDIKNVKVPGNEEESAPVMPKKNEKKYIKEIVDDIPGNPVTPWDILNG